MQKNMKVKVYHEKLLQLIVELNELQINEIVNCDEVQKSTVKLIYNNYALNVFKNGLNAYNVHTIQENLQYSEMTIENSQPRLPEQQN